MALTIEVQRAHGGLGLGPLVDSVDEIVTSRERCFVELWDLCRSAAGNEERDQRELVFHVFEPPRRIYGLRKKEGLKKG
jgi:hypothetical protein